MVPIFLTASAFFTEALQTWRFSCCFFDKFIVTNSTLYYKDHSFLLNLIVQIILEILTNFAAFNSMLLQLCTFWLLNLYNNTLITGTDPQGDRKICWRPYGSSASGYCIRYQRLCLPHLMICRKRKRPLFYKRSDNLLGKEHVYSFPRLINEAFHIIRSTRATSFCAPMRSTGSARKKRIRPYRPLR